MNRMSNMGAVKASEGVRNELKKEMRVEKGPQQETKDMAGRRLSRDVPLLGLSGLNAAEGSAKAVLTRAL
jgi:hypothetical protein